MWDLPGCGEAPWRVCFVLGPGSQDLMRKLRNRESLVPPLQGTVYLISCIFMKKIHDTEAREPRIGLGLHRETNSRGF